MQDAQNTILERARTVRHFDIDTGRPFGDFRAAYEEAVPHFDRLEAIGVALSGAGWSAVQGLSAATAPHGFVNFFTFDPSPVMAVNGHTGHGVTYLAGNIVKAEAGFGVDPACFLYIPLRVAIAEDGQGHAHLSFDHPDDLFAVFSNPGLDQVAADFSTSFRALLGHLGLPEPRAEAGPADPGLPEGELIDVSRQFLTALGGQDWAAMRRLVAPHASWTFPGEARISGPARGIDAIIAKAAAITSGGVHIEVQHVLAGTTGGAFVLHNTAADGSGALDQYLVSTLNVSDGRVDRIETFLSEPSKIAAYFGR
ncbi:MAG TPA: nuclear transport factor 2 family protein [Streptosporangiaceae bacterium]|jgi:limonene-1,2-epoxide hydrolase